MNTKHLLASFGLALGMALALLCALGSQNVGTEVALAAAPSAPSLRTCWARLNDDPTDYATVQAAVDAAGEEDTVKVAGYCTGVESRPRQDVSTTGVVTQVVYVSKTVTIRGGYTTTNWTAPDPEANPTTLDAGEEGRVLYVTGEVNPTIEGLRITGGTAQDLGGAPPSYYWSVGGGVYIITATATLIDNQIVSNWGFDCGGGLSLVSSNTVIDGNSVVSNGALQGGGLCLLDSSPTLIGNTIAGNDAWHGSGLWVEETRVSFSGNQVISNSAQACGGGLYVLDSDGELINNVIADNQAGGYNDECDGGGLYVASSQLHLLHTTIARNTGGGGSAVYVYGEAPDHAVWLTNTILTSHTIGVRAAGSGVVTVNGVLWYDTPTPTLGTGVMVQNQHTGDPAFALDGYHIISPSAAIDAGVDTGVTGDIDGHPRPQGAAPDLGADEVFLPSDTVYLPLVSVGDSSPPTLQREPRSENGGT